MFDLSLGQKFGIGFFMLVFAFAGVYLYYGLRPAPDMTVSSWIENHPIGVDRTKPISPANPIDPKTSFHERIFACFDGKLYVIEYSPESEKKYYFTFRADARHDNNAVLYKDPWAALEKISDDYKKTISFAAYADAEGTRLNGGSILRRAKLTVEQLDAESVARKKMEADVNLVDDGCRIGTFKPDDYQKVVAAYTTYVAYNGDPAKDATKAALATKFLKLAFQYVQLMDEQKAIAINKYIDTVGSILTQDQKNLIGGLKNLAVRPRIQPVTAG